MKIKLDRKNFDIFSLRMRDGIETRRSEFSFSERNKQNHVVTFYWCSTYSSFNGLPSLGRLHIFIGDGFFRKDVEFKDGFVEITL